VKRAWPEAARALARKGAAPAGLLLHGEDAMRVALRRAEAAAALVGPDAEAEMRLARMSAATLRADPAAASDAMRAQGFFPGPRAVVIEDATDAHAAPILAALAEWQAGDATLVVTAGRLAAKSALRKGFEAAANALAVAIHDDPPGPDELAALIAAAGLSPPGPAAMADITALARVLDPGDLRLTLDRIALYKHGDDTPLSPAEIAACAPATIEAELDAALHAAAEGEAGTLPGLLARLSAQGVAPVTLCIATARHFRILHAAAADPGGPAAGLARARPPVFGPRRERMQRQARIWGLARLEQALAILVETDLGLRSSHPAPAMAVMERVLIRLAMLARRQG